MGVKKSPEIRFRAVEQSETQANPKRYSNMTNNSELRVPSSALSRRDLFRLGSAGVATACAAPWFQTLAARAAEVKPSAAAKTKSVILVWLIGGPPQSLTLDIAPARLQ